MRQRRRQPAGVHLLLGGRSNDARPRVRIDHRMRGRRAGMMMLMMMVLRRMVERMVRRRLLVVRLVMMVAVLMMVRRHHWATVVMVRRWSVVAGLLVGRQHALGDQFAQLLLPDAVVAVRYQVLAHLGQGVRGACVRLGGRRQCRNLHVQFVVQVRVLGIVRGAQFLFLCVRRRKRGRERSV